jgi:hypothetical protein
MIVAKGRFSSNACTLGSYKSQRFLKITIILKRFDKILHIMYFVVVAYLGAHYLCWILMYL